MSAWGQKRTLSNVAPMSALPPIADILGPPKKRGTGTGQRQGWPRGRASTSIDHDVVVIVQSRQALRTRHSHCCVVKRTCNRAVGKCSDAKPCVDTNQDKHGDSGGEQSDLAHMTLCIPSNTSLA